MRRVVIGVLAVCSLTVAPAAAQATVFYVSSTADTDTGSFCTDPNQATCTLRHAINLANDDEQADQIIPVDPFTSADQTITLTAVLPTVTEPLTIDWRGTGHRTTVDANHAAGIFRLDLASAGDPVGIKGLTLANGTAAAGAAITSVDALFSIDECTFTGNTATGSTGGGAVYSQGQEFAGGGFGSIANSTFNDNHAETAGARGGGLLILNTFGSITSTTFSGNTADSGAAIGHESGFNGPGETITSSTIVGNTAAVSGGGIYQGDTGPKITLRNSVVANTAPAARDLRDGTSGQHGFNAEFTLIQDTTGAGSINETATGSNITGVDPQLGTLADYGGPVQTMLPQSDSPVLDAGRYGPTEDVRGKPLPIDLPEIVDSIAPGHDGSDMGAVEAQKPTPVIDAGPDGLTTDRTPSFTFHATGGEGDLLGSQCSLDAGTPNFDSCASGDEPGPFADGDYTFRLKMNDTGFVGDTVTRAIRIDATAPTTRITKSKIKKKQRRASFRFTGADMFPGVTFQCKIDKTAYKTCRSGVTYRHLKRHRNHRFSVRARDAAGHVDATPMSKRFKI